MAPRLQCLPTSYQPRGPDPERVCSAVPTGPQSLWILVISEGIQGAGSTNIASVSGTSCSSDPSSLYWLHRSFAQDPGLTRWLDVAVEGALSAQDASVLPTHPSVQELYAGTGHEVRGLGHWIQRPYVVDLAVAVREIHDRLRPTRVDRYVPQHGGTRE